MKRVLSLSGMLLALLHPSATDARPNGPPKIAICTDGPSDMFAEAVNDLAVEVDALLASRFPGFAFPRKATHEADFTQAGATKAVQAALADKTVDMVVCFGIASGKAVAKIDKLSKPVFLPYAAPRLQGLPGQGGTSGRKNLAYLTGLVDLERELGRFRDVIQRKNVVLLADQTILDAAPQITAFVERLNTESTKVSVVGVGASAAEVLAAIPKDAEAVYLGPLTRLPKSENAALLEGLNARKLPSYASEGKSWVEAGAFVTLVPDEDDQRRLRRIALYIESAVSGDALEKMRTAFVPRAALVINMATAKRIGVYPTFELMTEAQLVGQGDTERGELLTLKVAVEMATEANFGLIAARKEVPLARTDVREATGAFLPSVDANGTFTWLDPDVASPFGNPERTLSWGLSGQQLIFSPLAVGALRAQSAILGSAEATVRATELDTVRAAAVSYLDVLRAKTGEQINRENLRALRRNLELAELRVQIGSAGRQEVFRWVAEVANGKAAVIQANAGRNQAELLFNRTINRPLEASVRLEVPSDSPEALVVDPRLQTYVDDPWSFRILRGFMAREAVANAPEIAQLEAAIEAQEQLLSALRYQLFLPDAFLSGGFTHNLARGGEGKEGPDPALGFPARDDFTWQLGLGVNLRVFDFGRYAEIDRARITVEQLQTNRSAVAQGVEQGVRAALHQAGASRAAMKLRKEAAEAAGQNLNLVTDSYQKGVTNIITLVDAQNQSLQTQLASANAVFDFLVDYLNVERASARFSFRATEADRDDFAKRLEAFAKEPQQPANQ